MEPVTKALVDPKKKAPRQKVLPQKAQRVAEAKPRVEKIPSQQGPRLQVDGGIVGGPAAYTLNPNC